jgi:hypothetical protein
LKTIDGGEVVGVAHIGLDHAKKSEYSLSCRPAP